MKKIVLFAAMALFTLTASAQVKFAYVNFNELVMLTPEADAARTQMQAAQKEASDTYQSMVDEANAKFNEYQQKQATWTPAIKENKEKELTEIQNRINEFIFPVFKHFFDVPEEGHGGRGEARQGRWLYLCFRHQPVLLC